MIRRHLASLACGLLAAAMACAFGPSDSGAVATAVAETLTALPTSTSTPVDATAAPSETHTPSTTNTPAATTTPPPPPDGVSLNCDETYQWVRLVDGGASGKSLIVDDWNGSAWEEAWRFDGGDPMIRQIQDEAGAFSFGGCQQLIIVPVVYTGSGAVLELTIYEWNGAGVTEVLSGEGVHGSWELAGDLLTMEESVYLYGEPNCCPCNRQVERYQWTGAAFVEQGISLNPTYEGEAPPMCTGS